MPRPGVQAALRQGDQISSGPGSREHVTITYNHRICVVSTDDGHIPRTFDQEPDIFPRIGWTPDGEGLVFARRSEDSDNPWLQPLDGNEPLQLTDFQTGSIVGFAFSTGGDSVAVATREEVGDVVLFEDYRSQIARVLSQTKSD